MSDVFRFETFVDVHSNIFEEYLSSVIGKLPKDNEDYRAIWARYKPFMSSIRECLRSLTRKKRRI